MGGGCCPSPPPPSAGDAGAASPPPPRCWAFPPLLLLRCGDVEPHSGPRRIALANVTSLRLPIGVQTLCLHQRHASRRWHNR